MLKELKLFENDCISLQNRYFVLLDILITNQSTSRFEIIFLFLINYIQFLSGFFSNHIEVLQPKTSKSDFLLYQLHKLFRVKDFFINNIKGFSICIYLCFGFMVVFFAYFVFILLKVNKTTFYSFKIVVLNYFLKFFLYVFFNLTLDNLMVLICFEESGKSHPFFNNKTCNIGGYIPEFIIALITALVSISFNIFIQLFYNDAFYMSSSFYAKISCDYALLFTLNQTVNSILLIEAKYILREVYLIYNLFISALFLKYLYDKYVFFNKGTNIMAGIFHMIYFWTSIFFTIFAYLNYSEKGLIYCLTCLVVGVLYFNIRFKIEEIIILKTPYYKIQNKYYLLYYLKFLVDTINEIDQNPEKKALLTGILKMHKKECPNAICISKTSKKIYLPLTNNWSDRSKEAIDDKVYLNNFIIVIMNFFVSQNYVSPEMIINEAIYFLQNLGNYCQAILFYKKVKEMKMTVQEYFSFKRLQLAISKLLVEKLQPSNEPCNSLEEMNCTFYYKYEDLREQFINELYNDLTLSLEFWKAYKNAANENLSLAVIDFNHIFEVVEKIKKSKEKIEQLWNQLFSIYPGVNNLFDLYCQYIEIINDDDLLKRDMDSIRRKNESPSENIQLNFYNILFHQNTGIIIINGDNEKEGIIEKSNAEIEQIFLYTTEELKGMNIDKLMPKLFEKKHKEFMKRYVTIGEKRIIDKKDFFSLGKDKCNSLIYLNLSIKLFPILNESIFFVSMIVKENVDDMILIDDKFIIQGMSLKLMERLNVDSKMLFQENEIPFYVICKKFLSFYKIFLKGKKKQQNAKNLKNSFNFNDESNESTLSSKVSNIKPKGTDKEIHQENENIEITENIELEYEIRIPQFIFDYQNLSQNAEIGKLTSLEGTQLMNSSLIDKEPSIKKICDNDGNNEEPESELLIPKDKTPKGIEKETPFDNNTNNKKLSYTSRQINTSNKKNPREKEYEKKLFQEMINKHKTMFDNNQFDDLEELIDKCTSNCIEAYDFKFNFTFDKYLYGELKEIAYIIRCIDNKNIVCESDEDSKLLINDNDSKIKRDKIDFNKTLIQITQTDKLLLINRHENFLELTFSNKTFQQNLNTKQAEIGKISSVHGNKKEDAVMDDENSSQTSQTAYKSDLSKTNRIDEIRRNVMKNVSNFYLLKYIKLLEFFAIVISIVFAILYIFQTTELYNDLLNKAKLNSDLFLTTIWMSNVASSIVSMRSLFNLKINKESFVIQMFTGDDEIVYFDHLRNISLEWYRKVANTFPLIVMNIRDSIKTNESLFWDDHPVSYVYDGLPQDNEPFPLGVSQILSNIRFLLNQTNFILEFAIQNNVTKEDKEIINFGAFMPIENSLLNLMPAQMEKLKTLPTIFADNNSDKVNVHIILLIIFCVTMLLLSIIYIVVIYITNKSMGEGLKKVLKINIKIVEEIINKTEKFQQTIPYYKDVDFALQNDNNKNENKKHHSDHHQSNSSSSNQGFNTETKNMKELTLLKGTYFQTGIMFILSIGFLVPVFLSTWAMIDATNKMLYLQVNLYGNLFIGSVSTVDAKCVITHCKITKEILNYTSIKDLDHVRHSLIDLPLFPKLYSYYNNKYLLNACKAAFESETQENYTNCLKDTIIISANNTDSLLNLLSESVSDLKLDKKNKDGFKLTLPNKTEIIFDSLLLLNSTTFFTLERNFFLYLTPVSDRLAEVFKESLDDYLDEQKQIILILLVVFMLLIVALMFYIAICYMNKLIYLLLVSRCILKIIPTMVINNTDELGKWIDNKY